VYYGSANLSKTRCSLTGRPLFDPVLASCGHLYERKVADSGQLSLRTLGVRSIQCAACTLAIHSFSEVPDPYNLIKDWQEVCTIVVMSTVEKEEKDVAEEYLKRAELLTNAGNYEEALASYSKAFLYTNSSEHYTGVPELYKKMKERSKATLAYLQLAISLCKEGKLQEARNALAGCQSCGPIPLKVHALLVAMYLTLKHEPEELNDVLVLAAQDEDPESAIFICKQVLTYDPTLLEAYAILSTKLKDIRERDHFHLKAAQYAEAAGKLGMSNFFRDQSRRDLKLAKSQLIDG